MVSNSPNWFTLCLFVQPALNITQLYIHLYQSHLRLLSKYSHMYPDKPSVERHTDDAICVHCTCVTACIQHIYLPIMCMCCIDHVSGFIFRAVVHWRGIRINIVCQRCIITSWWESLILTWCFKPGYFLCVVRECLLIWLYISCYQNPGL